MQPGWGGEVEAGVQRGAPQHQQPARAIGADLANAYRAAGAIYAAGSVTVEPDLLAMNMPIARATHAYAVTHNIVARREDVRSLTLPFGHSYTFGMPMLITYGDGRIVAANPDLRRKEPLTETGRHFLFSAMHHRWRENYPDLSNIGLEDWRYEDNPSRTVRAILCSEQDLESYDAILTDVRETYEIWHAVLAQSEAARRHGSGDDGPLFAAR